MLSVLLPTRNGARYLHDCIASVLSADLDDLELIVSDNASEDDTQEILATFLHDSRIRVQRQPTPISVTDNWGKTVGAARGDYLLLLGDDDLMLPGSLEYLAARLADYNSPEILTFDAYGFAFPGALDRTSPVYVSDRLFPHDSRLPSSGVFPLASRTWCVKGAFRFDPPFRLNLQSTLISRRALSRLRHGPFRAPYPDFYAALGLMLTAETWVHIPRKLVVVGITEKSFARSLMDGGTDAGRSYLGIETEFDGCLPGHDMTNGFYLMLEQLKEGFPEQLKGVEISRSDYVYRQMYYWYLAARLGTIDRAEVSRRLRLLSPRDWFGFVKELVARLNLDMLRRHARVDHSSAIASVWPNMRPCPEYSSIVDFAERAARAQALVG